MTTITETTDTLLNQMGGAAQIARMTNCQIVVGDNFASLVFGRQVGPRGKKITHLKVTYNAGSDLYDVQAWKMSKKTFEMTPVFDLPGVDCGQLKEICERVCDLFFTIN
jgi:hypothetical protein